MAHNQQYLELADSPMHRHSLQSETLNCNLQSDSTIETRKSARRISINNRKLVLAAGDGKFNKLEYYIKEGGNVNFQDRDGNTALHWAIENDQLQVIEFLLCNGATYLKNNQNETPMELAERLKKLDVLEILKFTNDSNIKVDDSKLENMKASDNENAGGPNIDDSSVPNSAKQIGDEIDAETCEDGTTNIEYKHGKRCNPVHGNIYQLKVLMLFLYRGISKGYSFKLGTEIEEANKFDDLVFEYTENNQKVYRLLQAKHKLDESRKITTRNLLGNTKDDYSLIKYFLSYEQSKNANVFQQGTIKDVTVCTNIDFHFDNLASAGIKVQKLENTDDILDVESSFKQPVRYRFDIKVADLLHNKLKSTMCSIFSIDEVHEFLDHLVFAVNQPNEDELGRIIKHEIGKEFDLLTTENLYNKLFQRMLNWLQGKDNNEYLSSREGELFFEEARRGMPVLFDIRTPVQSFTGRTKELHELHNMLQGENGKPRLVCICGLGGIGKTELARKYVDLNSELYDKKIIWINADSYESLAASFHRLASDKLKIGTKNVNGQAKEIRSIVEDVYIYFTKQKSLFVFDNAEKYISQKEFDAGIQEFLPSLPSADNFSHVLITSRNKKWPSHIKVLALNMFDELEATNFLKKSLDSVDDSQMSKLANLAIMLDFMPLALQQAVSYINIRNENCTNLGLQFTILDYINVYEKQAKEFLKSSHFIEDSGSTYAQTVFTTWNITFEMIAQKESGNIAVEILRIASYLAPENIPIHFFSQLLTDAKQLESAISLLSQYSLITVENALFNIHRLLQQVIKMNVQEQKLESQTLTRALRLFSRDNVTTKCVAHAISVWNQSTVYNNLLIEFSEVTSYISCALLDGDRYEEAYVFGLSVLDRIREQPEMNLKIYCTMLSTHHNIGMALHQQGKYDMALKILQQVLDMQIKSGWDPTLCLNTKFNIALTLYKQGELDGAFEAYKEICDFEKIVGPSHPDILSAKEGIATVLMTQGKTIGTSQILTDIRDVHEESFKKDHLKTLYFKNTLGASLLHEGKFDEALQILLEAYDIGIQTVGRTHSSMFQIMHNISAVYFKKNDFKTAVQWSYDELNAQETFYGKDHPSVLVTRSEIARTLLHQNKTNEALEICRAAFNKQTAILGPRHSDTLATQFLLGEIYASTADFNTALEMHRDVLHKRNIIFYNSHPDVLHSMNNIGEILLQQEKFDDALLYFQQIFIIQNRTLGEHNLSTLYCKATINILHLNNRRNYYKAFQTLYDTFRIMKRLYPHDFETVTVNKNLAAIYCDKNKHDEALPIFKEVIHYYEATFGKDDIRTLSAKIEKAEVLRTVGKTSQALELFQEARLSLNTVLDPQNPRILDVDASIQHILKLNNDLLDAVLKNRRIIVQQLVADGGDVNAKGSDGWSVLHHAVNNDNISIVIFLLKNGADITQRTVNGSTVLHIAVSRGFSKVAEVLLRHTEDSVLSSFVDTRKPSNGSSALHIAAKKGFSEIVKYLLKYGASHNIRNEKNRVPLELSENEKVIKLLVLIRDLFQDAESGNFIRLIRTLQSLSYDTHLAVINARHVCNTISPVGTASDTKNIAEIVMRTLQRAGNR